MQVSAMRLMPVVSESKMPVQGFLALSLSPFLFPHLLLPCAFEVEKDDLEMGSHTVRE